MPELVISWIVLGAVAGCLAYLWSPYKLPGGFVSDILLGILGAVIGGYLINYVTGGSPVSDPVTWGSLIVTVVSALIFLMIILTESSHRRTARSRS